MRKYIISVGFFLLTHSLVWGALHPALNHGQVYEIPMHIETVLYRLPAELLPTMDAPQLLPEPEYTIGTVNTLYWTPDSVINMLNGSGYTLLFFEARALIDTSERWVFVEANVDSATFFDLPEGISIDYQLRYYAQHTDGTYALSHWSDSESSIQDVDAPILQREDSYVLDTQVAGNQKWVFDRTIQISIVASDSVAGKVSQVLIKEESASAVQQIAYDFSIPAVYVNDVILLYLDSEPRQEITLTWWIYDVAGQKSEPQTETILLWPKGEESPSDVVCFPNPVCPDQGEIAKIKVGLEDLTKARIFDLFGNHIVTIYKSSESSFFQWDCKNSRGNYVAQGGYLCVIDGDTNLYCKIAIIR